MNIIDNVIDKIEIGTNVYNLSSNATFFDRWEYVECTIYPNSLYDYQSKSIEEVSSQYTCINYVFKGEQKIKFNGANSGTSRRLAYCILDEEGNILSIPDFVSMEGYKDTIINIPDGAYEIYINGHGAVSPHLEVSRIDLRSYIGSLSYLLSDFGKKLQYKEKFAWKPMPTGLVAFTFDDSLDDTGDIVDLFISKGVPCCFGAIPEKLNMSLANGETIAQAMKRGVDAVGCEVLAHGSSGSEIVTEDNIDSMDFLYNKFVVNKQKLIDFGFNIRGTVRVGGSGNICNDPRTDVWVRLFFDYGDLYGLEEPYNHARVSLSTELEGYKAAIDKAIVNKSFTPLLFHQCPDYMGELIDYAIAQGAVVCNYAYAYDTYGSTVEKVDVENRLQALENIGNGNGVSY